MTASTKHFVFYEAVLHFSWPLRFWSFRLKTMTRICFCIFSHAFDFFVFCPKTAIRRAKSKETKFIQFWLAINKLFSKYQKTSGVSFFSSKNPTVITPRTPQVLLKTFTTIEGKNYSFKYYKRMPNFNKIP